MDKNKVTIDYHDSANREAAADFILGLVKSGLTFTANQDGDTLVITLTGGY